MTKINAFLLSHDSDIIHFDVIILSNHEKRYNEIIIFDLESSPSVTDEEFTGDFLGDC